MSEPPSPAPVGAFAASRVTLDGTVSITQPPTGEKNRDFLDIVSAFAPILSGVIVAIVAYFLTDSVNTALKRQELQLSNATEMKALLLALEGPKPEEWRASAFTLSAFGAPAVPPLVSALTTADEVRTPIVEAALRGIGLENSKVVCKAMIAVLGNRTGRYTYLAHQSAIRLIGDLGCPEAGPVLERYSATVSAAIASGDLAPYSALVNPDKPPTAIAVQLVSEDLKRTSSIVEPK